MAEKFTQFCRDCLKQLNLCAVLWWSLVLATIASLIYLLSIVPRFQNVDPQDAYPADWLRTQENISLHGIFANFGSTGSKAYGASEGILLDSSVPRAQDRKSSALTFATRYVANPYNPSRPLDPHPRLPPRLPHPRQPPPPHLRPQTPPRTHPLHHRASRPPARHHPLRYPRQRQRPFRTALPPQHLGRPLQRRAPQTRRPRAASHHADDVRAVAD